MCSFDGKDVPFVPNIGLFLTFLIQRIYVRTLSARESTSSFEENCLQGILQHVGYRICCLSHPTLIYEHVPSSQSYGAYSQKFEPFPMSPSNDPFLLQQLPIKRKGDPFYFYQRSGTVVLHMYTSWLDGIGRHG